MQKTYLVDTNVFLEVLLSQKRKNECKKLLNKMYQGKIKGIVTDFTIHSIMVLMDNFRKHNELKTFLSSLTAYKELHIYTTTLADEIKALEETQKTHLDIDDALQYVAALSVNADAIISYDKHFDKLKLPRKEPKELAKTNTKNEDTTKTVKEAKE